MTLQGWVALAILAAAIVLLLKRWLPIEVTALSVPVALVLCGVLPDPLDALSGFRDPAVVTIASIFVVGAGLQESGVTTLLSRAMQRLGGGSEAALIALVLVVAAGVSAFASTAAVVAVFLPAIVALSRKTQVSPSRLLLPLSFGAILGCNMLALSSIPNMIVSAQAFAHGTPLGMLDFAKVGVPVLLACGLVLVVLRKWLLPLRTPRTLDELLGPEGVAREYGLPSTMYRMRVVAKSKVAGRTIAEAGIRNRYGLDVVAVSRTKRLRTTFHEPKPDLVLASGDELYLEGDDEAAWLFAEEEVVQFGLAGPAEIEAILGRGMTIAEVIVPPRSPAAGRTLKEIGFRTRYGLNVLALWREARITRSGLGEAALVAGDALVVSGKAESLRAFASIPDFVVISEHDTKEDVSRAPLALLLLAVAIVPPMAGWLPLPVSALAAAILMVGTGCIRVDDAEKALDWRVLLLIIGMLPLGMALSKTGVAAHVSGLLLQASEPFGTPAVLGALFVVAAALSHATTNGTAAAILFPVALSVGQDAHLGIRETLLAVAVGCNANFMLPFSSANLQIMVPGGYKASDYVRAGAVLTLVSGVVAVSILWAMSR
jgi:di/tricarboxylate transporter